MRPAATIILSLMLTACTGGEHSVPKPEAYPHIEMPAHDFEIMNVGDTGIVINTGTTASVEVRGKGNTWVTIKYPVGFEANVYLSVINVTHQDSVTQIMANRRERMALNLAGSEGVLTTLVSEGGWDCEMVTSHTSLSTPVQLLARKDDKIVSGALYMQLPAGTAPDSVTPVIDSVSLDILTMLKSLQ